jgi:hypothetical protein
MAAEERTLGQLVSDASRDVSELVRYEIALARAEVQRDVKRGLAAGGLFGAAAVLALYATVALMIAAGLGLALVMPAWLAFIVVALLFPAGRGRVRPHRPLADRRDQAAGADDPLDEGDDRRRAQPRW